MKTDRRVQKTKKLLTDALIRLMLKKSFDAITIQDILDEANVGRSTFYTHYENKEQLLLDGHANLNVKLFGTETGSMDFLPLFEHILGHRQLAKALFGDKAGNIMISFLKNNAAALIKKHYATRFSKTKGEQYRLRYLSEASASAVMSLLGSWIGDDFFLSTQQMASLCSQTVQSVFEGNAATAN